MNGVLTVCMVGLIAYTNGSVVPSTPDIDGRTGTSEDIVFVVLEPDAEARVAFIVDRMSQSSGRTAAATRADLEALWARGAGVYIQLDSAKESTEITLRHTSGSDVRIEGGTMSMHLSGADARQAAVMWVRHAEEGTYTLLIPKFVGHVTVVANGRLIDSVRLFDGGPHQIFVPVIGHSEAFEDAVNMGVVDGLESPSLAPRTTPDQLGRRVQPEVFSTPILR